jgi:hypothetical protein
MDALGISGSKLNALMNTSMLIGGFLDVNWFRELMFIYARTIPYGKIFERVTAHHFTEGTGALSRVNSSRASVYRHLKDALKCRHIIKVHLRYGGSRRPVPVYGLNISTLAQKMRPHKAGFRHAAALELRRHTEVLDYFPKRELAINCNNGGNKFMKIEEAFSEVLRKSEAAKKRKEARASKRKKTKGSLRDRIDDWLVIHGYEKPIWTGRTSGKLKNLLTKDFDGDTEKTYEFITGCFQYWSHIKYRLQEDEYITVGNEPNFEKVYNLRDKMKVIVDKKQKEGDAWPEEWE